MSRMIVLLLLLAAPPAVAGPLETIGPWQIGTLPSSVTIVTGGFNNGWTNVVEEAVTTDEIFRSVSLIHRGGANLLVGTVLELAFPVAVVNRAGPDLVLFGHFECTDELYRLSADHDGFTQEFDLTPDACVSLGMQEYFVETNAAFFETDYTASPIELSDLGVAAGASITTLRLAQVSGQPDPLGVATVLDGFAAYDDAADPAYDDGWQNGDDGGSGWASVWGLNSVNDPDQVVGFPIESSTLNGDGDDNLDGDIDTGGRAFGLLTADIAQPLAIRLLPEFTAGQTLRFEVDKTPVTGSAFFALNLIANGRVAFDFRAPSSGANYRSQFVDTGIPVSDEGVHGAFTLTSPDAYTLTLTPLDGTPSASLSGTLTETPIVSLRFSFQGSGDPADQIGYFNSISVPEPGGAGEALALGALGWAGLRRKRRVDPDAPSARSGARSPARLRPSAPSVPRTWPV